MVNDNKPATKSPANSMLSSPVQILRQLPNREIQIPPPTNGISYIVSEILSTLEPYQDSYMTVARGIFINHLIESGYLKGSRSTIYNIVKRYREYLIVNKYREISGCPHILDLESV